MKSFISTIHGFLARIPQRDMVLLLRTVHGLITLYFLSCIVGIYYAGLTNQVNTWIYLAIASLSVEVIVIVLNRGDCPFGIIHRKFGDDKAFFELFLPKPVAKKAVPVLGFVAAVGFFLLFV